ncbi:beta-galactosidase [Burkholderia sp. HI2761]|uniref:glycoside hydrolase family 2 protein n=1 Tax=Burkholderia TaxID=32008 RepID=UPI0004886C54|nr:MULTISPECIES: sugar-binding domain-containing protein [Burkholderia]MPV55133.1 beta-galactosidase [Burkholderia sp. BE24]OXJ21990.1 beta-galactosidase [Burkholderia sp. HI2761]
MKSKERRKFLSYSAALVGTSWLAGCNGDMDSPSGAAVTPSTDGPATVTPTVPGVPADPEHSLLATQQLTRNWTFAPASSLPGAGGAQLSGAAGVTGMAPATVPGTVLNSMIVNGKYPDPFYGRIVTDTIPDTLKDTDYWYRTTFAAPPRQPGQRLWLNFDGVNYCAEIWLNGALVGRLEGAFKQGAFDISRLVPQAGGVVNLAVRVVKLDFSEGPLLPNYQSGVTRGGRNGGPTGVTLKNGPTFFCSAGWDWLPTIPDRNLGIWQPVSWFTTGSVRIAAINVAHTLSADLSRAELRLDLELDNGSGQDLVATLVGSIGNGATFSHDMAIPASSTTTKLSLTSSDIAALSIRQPRLWWPNGYGEPDLYAVTVGIKVGRLLSDERTLNVGLRRIDYSRDIGQGTQLSITVNGLPILVMGGNWGLDEALKRIPRERLFNQVRLHRDANLNLIRNWNGQSTSDDFFDACDRYGILVWQDFFFSTEGDGSGAANVPRDLDDIRDVIARNRHRPSILLWCGGNEGAPPPALVKGLDALVAELDPQRLCLTSSAGDTGAGAVNGYSSGGPYNWASPQAAFSRGYGTTSVAFHNEVGSHSIPTLEFVESMLPPGSYDCPDDFWADRDMNGNGAYYDQVGKQGGAGYIAMTALRYGAIRNLADFVRKAQMMNYECIRSIYEANAAVMIGPVAGKITSPATGVIMWMTNPSQPSFVWQMYSHDLEEHSSFFAVRHGCRRVNAILDANTADVTIANHTSAAVTGRVEMRVYNLDGTLSSRATADVGGVARASYRVVANLKPAMAAAKSDVCIVSLALTDSGGNTLAENVYWRQRDGGDTSYTSLDTMPGAAVAVGATSAEVDDVTTRITVDVANAGATIALMTHLQVFDPATGARILPAFYSDNYLNLMPGAKRRITIDLPHANGAPVSRVALRIDGWRLDRPNCKLGLGGVPVVFNERALAVDQAVATFATC